METIAYNCKTKGISVSEPTEYLINAYREEEFMNKKIFLSQAEIVRFAIDFLVTEKYPHLFDNIQEFIKE